MGKVAFHLIGTISFHAKTDNEEFTAARQRCRQNYKFEKFTLSFGRNNAPVPEIMHVKHDYFFSLNQSHHCFVAFSLTCCHWLLPR